MKYALITGASSGLGAEYARQLAQKKCWNLTLLARREDRLNELKQQILNVSPEINVICYPCDLTDRVKRSELALQLRNKNLQCDLLINNAGFGSVVYFAEADVLREQNMVELNCIAPLELSHAVLQAWGRNLADKAIINVCSTASFQPLPCMATYAATKSFLRSFSLALGQELRAEGLCVQALCPGPTPTEFHLHAGLAEKMDYLPTTSAAEVVSLSLKRLETNTRVLIPGRLNQFLKLISQIVPTNLGLKITHFLLKRYVK